MGIINETIFEYNLTHDTLIGLAIGDALGVPVDSFSRNELQEYPVKGMRAYGTHAQPRGTWSDESSLAFCLAESLCEHYDLHDIATKFVHWNSRNYWTARGEVFDIEYDTKKAISRLSALLYLEEDVTPIPDVGTDCEVVRNGALARVLPLVFYLLDKPIEERFLKVRDVSALTHPHLRSVMACFVLIEFARQLILESDKKSAYLLMQKQVIQFLLTSNLDKSEIKHFHCVLSEDIYDLPESQIRTSDSVIDTLEAALWAVMTANTYKSTVLKAVNLGEYTDTTAGVAGGLAGIIYGVDEMPQDWLSDLARIEDIIALGNKMEQLL